MWYAYVYICPINNEKQLIMSTSLNGRRFRYAHKLAADWASFKNRKKHGNMQLRYRDLFAAALQVAYAKVTDAPRVQDLTDLGVLTIDRETEKAIAFKVVFECFATGQERTRTMWMPKSMMQGTTAPAWFVTKKLDELRSEFHYSGQLGVVNLNF